MGQSLRVLIVEDSEEDSALLQHALRRGGYDIDCEVVDTPAAMRSALSRRNWDVITSDHSMPRFSAPVALALAKELRPDVPFIILSGEIDLNLAVSLMRGGAKDYIQKRELVRLVPAIERELKEAELRRERRRVDAELLESEANLVEAQQIAHLGSWQWDMLSNTVHWSKEMYRVFDIDPETYDGKPESLLQVIHPDDLESFTQSMNSNLSGGRSPTLEYRVIHKDGSIHHILANGRFEFDTVGRPIRGIGTVQDITERKSILQALREGEEQFRQIVERSDDVFYRQNIRTRRFEYVSPKVYELLGLTPQEFLALDFEAQKEKIHPEDLPRVLHFAQDLIDADERDEKHLEREFRIKTMTRGYRWIHGNYNLVRDHDGSPWLVVGSLSDVTERKLVEEALLQANERLSLAQRAANAGVWDWDMLTGQLNWSPEFFQIFGLDVTRAEATFDTWRSVLHPDDLQTAGERINEAIDQHTPLFNEYRIVLSSGETRWIQAFGDTTYDEHGKALRMAGICIDITGRKQAEEELRQSQERFQIIFNTLLEGVALNEIVFNPAGEMIDYRIIEVNAAFYRFVNRPKEVMIIGNLATKLYGMDAETIRYFWEHHQNVTETQYAELASPITGRIFGISTSPFKNNRFVTSFQDITERKQTEEQIRRLNSELEKRVADRTAQLKVANQELEAFSYSVSHDLRAPLRTLDGYSKVLLEDYARQLDEQGQHYLTRIQKVSQRMDLMIHDLLKLSQVTTLANMPHERVDLSALAEGIAAELKAQSPHRQVQFDIAANLIVRGDENLLKIVIENLLSNASKFTSQRELALIQVGVMDRDGEQVYFVRDNGAGFNMAGANKLFVPFQRLHHENEFPGIGIGLATVQRIIHRHNGRIWAEGAQDQGATFYFTVG